VIGKAANSNSRLRPAHIALIGIALGLLAQIVFLPGLPGHFVLDDFPNIVQNRAILIDSLSVEALARAASAYSASFNRPLATISFAIDHSLWGLSPLGFKITNILIHALNTLLVFTFAAKLLKIAGSHTETKPVAAAVAFIWAIHPLQVSTVLYVVQRMEMLAATSMLTALILYLAGRERQIAGRAGWALVLASAPVAATGLLSKESAMLFPLFALVIEWGMLRFRARELGAQRVLRACYATGIAVGAALYLFVAIPHFTTPEAYALREFDHTQRVLSQPWVLTTYLGHMLVPLPASMLFNYDHLIAPASLTSNPSTLVGIGALCTLAALAVLARRQGYPLIAVGIAWFFAAHSMTSNIAPLELAFEHRNYLALLGIVLASFAALSSVIPPQALRAVGIALVITLAALTLMRSSAWGSALDFAVENATNNPASSRASNDLAIEYAELSGYDPASPWFLKAITEFERGAALPQATPLPEQSLILIHALNGLPVQERWWDSLEKKLASNHIRVAELLAAGGLLDRSWEGLPLDRQRVENAWRIVDSRKPWPPEVRARFADWLAKDPSQASRAAIEFTKARSGANPALVRQIDLRLAALFAKPVHPQANQHRADE